MSSSIRKVRTFCIALALVGGFGGDAAAQIGLPPQPTQHSALAPRVRPKEVEVQFNRAEAAWKSGSSLLEAKARVDQVLRALPEDAEALKLRARILLALHRPAEAVTDARRAVRLRPQDLENYLILSEAAHRANEPLLAVETLLEAEQHLPRTFETYLGLARCALLVDALEPAERYSVRALRLRPSEPAPRYQLARVLVLRQRPDAAAGVLYEGLRRSLLDPDVIRGDSLLTRLSGHARIADLLR